MVFADDTTAGLQAAAALVNTCGTDDDTLTTIAELDTFLDAWNWTGSRRRDRKELEQVRALRPRLRRLWELSEHELVTEINQILRDSHALPQLVTHGTTDYHLHATSSDAPLVDRMAVEAAMAVVDVVRQHELDRLRICDADDCDDVLVDLSKNKSRRYCSATCSNRINVAAFRARRR